MESLTFVTGNSGKYLSVKEQFEKNNLTVGFYTYDAKELEINDIEKISKNKASDAYKILNKPCFVSDTGFYIENYPNNPGYPGAFVKRSNISSDVDSLLNTMKNVKNRNCKFVDCLTFFDGNEYYTFFGVSSGTLSCEKRGNWNKKFKSNLWYVFIPKNCSKTLAEMSDEERENRCDGRTSALNDFIIWYKNEYLKQKSKTLIL